MRNLPAPELTLFCQQLFNAAGLSLVDAQVLAESVIGSSLVGHDSHGIMLVGRYVNELIKGDVDKECRLTFEKEFPSTACINANNSQGHIASQQVTRLAIDKALKHGVATVTVHNLGHLGRLGTYVEMAAMQDCVAIATINNHGGATWMAPFGGTERRLPPNPIAIGAPTGGEFPLVLDMSASNVAVGKCIVAQAKGESIPLDWILDPQGNPTTDPSQLVGPPSGSLIPLGGTIAGHKGYALAFMMDILGGALSPAGCSRSTEYMSQNGFFLTVLKIENFVELTDFHKEANQLIDWVKSSPTVSPDREILAPGEFEYRMRLERVAEGIPVPDPVCEGYRKMAEELEVENILDL
ncbi:Ldh family oxidoreductase [Polystyrenella longa]|uniref:Ldh family oxidoreductase n=1 Tax=Polystyrenella longa TaxID=2528007 RepID=UPI0018D21E51|nr:Ldh family oxidoreductase [Polystyrenella longa]